MLTIGVEAAMRGGAPRVYRSCQHMFAQPKNSDEEEQIEGYVWQQPMAIAHQQCINGSLTAP